MTWKPPILKGHDPDRSIGRFTDSGMAFDDEMTPESFRMLAFAIAGPCWKTRLGPMIGKCRTQVWEYANGKREVPETVEKLMQLLVKAQVNAE